MSGDLVAHCGSTSAGQFLFTLSTVDVATGWMLCRGVRNKGEQAVFEELAEIRRRLPFPLLGLDSDNGGEFINRTLVHYCEDESITLTRARPYRKNDSCHVELCGHPHNSTYADSGIMPIEPEVAPRPRRSLAEVVGIIPPLR